MTYTTILPFIYLVVAAGVSISLSITYGDDGIEAFLSAFLGLVFAYLFQNILLIRKAMRNYNVIILVALSTFLFILSGMIMVVCLGFLIEYLPEVVAKYSLNINWVIVTAGTIVYCAIRLIRDTGRTIQTVGIGFIVTLYSVLASIAALVHVASENTKVPILLLTIVVNLQIILTFIFMQTTYVKGVVAISHKLSSTRYLRRSRDAEIYICLFLFALPLITPMILTFILFDIGIQT